MDDILLQQYTQNIQKLLQQTNEAIEEFHRAPYGNSVLNFLVGKVWAYKKVLAILEEKRKEKR